MAPSPEPARWGGRPIPARANEPVTTALARGGFPLLARSIRYHRPRAAFCGIGACGHCLVQVNGTPNVRACRYVPRPGDDIRPALGWPSARFDLGAVFDLLFRRGLDTLHGFRRPRFAAPLYHAVIRRLAGTGRLPERVPATPFAPAPGAARADAVVVGAGPAGRAAAASLAADGRSVIVLDRRAGGDPVPGATVRWSTTAAFLPPPRPDGPWRFHVVSSPDEGPAETIEAASVIVASGAYDGTLLFDGNDRPGVLTADAAFALAPDGGRPPFARAVVVGGGDRATELLDRFGGEVEAVVSPGSIEPGLADRAARFEVPLYPRTLLVGATGRARVRGARLRTRGDGPAFSIAGDAIVLAHRRLPQTQLLFQAGAAMAWAPSTGAYYPVLDGVATSVPGLYAVGEAAGFVTPAARVSSGEAAAAAIAGRLAAAAGARIVSEPPGELAGYYRELRPFLERSRRVFACPCEDVLLSEVAAAHRRGFRGLEVVKRYTGVGTGVCQGRFCLPDALLWLSLLEERPPEEVGYITQRPPVHPVALGALAALPGDGSAEEAAS